MAISGSTPRRWAKCLGWLALSLAALAIGALLVVNVIDYRRYYWAAHFEQSAGLEKVRELAHTCFELGKIGRGNFSEYPANIAELKPHWVSVDRDYAQIGLYGHDDDASVFLSFERDHGNEVVTVCDYTRGDFQSRPIYVKDQAAYDFLSPKDRIVTLGQWGMHDYIEWIVLPHEIRVINFRGTGGAEVLGQRPISQSERAAVEAAVAAIPAAVRGRHFSSGAVDGIHLDISFGARGRQDPSHFELDNTWREEAGPLVDLVQHLSPQSQELKFRARVQDQLKRYPSEQFSATWAEEAERNRPRRVWWCLWPRFVMDPSH